jgi:hypothetical protein
MFLMSNLMGVSFHSRELKENALNIAKDEARKLESEDFPHHEKMEFRKQKKRIRTMRAV